MYVSFKRFRKFLKNNELENYINEINLDLENNENLNENVIIKYDNASFKWDKINGDIILKNSPLFLLNSINQGLQDIHPL